MWENAGNYVCILLNKDSYYMWYWRWLVCVCVCLSQCVLTSLLQSTAGWQCVCTYSHSLPRRAGILATRCQIWSCIRFHVSSPVTCSKEYPLEQRRWEGGRERERERGRTERDRQRQKRRTGQRESEHYHFAWQTHAFPQFNITDTAHTVQESRWGMGVSSQTVTSSGVGILTIFSKSTKKKSTVIY